MTLAANSQREGMSGTRCLTIVALLILLVGFVVLDRTVLDPGGRGFSGKANDKCAKHDGVKEMNAQQGYVICWDGTAR